VFLLASLVLTSCASSTSVAATSSPTIPITPSPLVDNVDVQDCYGTDPEGPPIALVGGLLIDGTGSEPEPDAAVLIEGCRIVAVGTENEIELPEDAEVILLNGAAILPGFIDTHVHNTANPLYLDRWAQAGVTTVRDLGAPLGLPYFRWRDRQADDPDTARYLSAGPLVTVPEGYPIVPQGFSSLAVTSVEDARQQIAQLIADGAEVIKITIVPELPSLSEDEAAAIVETAHAHGIPVSAHATNRAALERALAAGVDDIAHMAEDFVPDTVMQQMIADEIYWVPTLYAGGEQGRDNLIRFVELGGIVALGTDAGYLDGIEIGMNMDELTLMHEAGMTPMQIIMAATRNAALVCRLEADLGTIEVGKLADILIVAGDPLADLTALEDVLLVIHGGVIIRNEIQ
jgi:imidazolonepropionase-like amidohydrolase